MLESHRLAVLQPGRQGVVGGDQLLPLAVPPGLVQVGHLGGVGQDQPVLRLQPGVDARVPEGGRRQHLPADQVGQPLPIGEPDHFLDPDAPARESGQSHVVVDHRAVSQGEPEGGPVPAVGRADAEQAEGRTPAHQDQQIIHQLVGVGPRRQDLEQVRLRAGGQRQASDHPVGDHLEGELLHGPRSVPGPDGRLELRGDGPGLVVGGRGRRLGPRRRRRPARQAETPGGRQQNDRADPSVSAHL